MKNKTDFRLHAKELRKSLDIPELSKSAVKKIRNFDIYKTSKNIMIFYPTRYEIDLRELLNDDKTFYLPKVSGKNLLVCPYNEKFIKSSFGIMEPDSAPVNPEILDMVIVPALMADKNGYRLGYGGGYYDRFLSKIKIPTLTIVPDILFTENLPHDAYDIPIDFVIHV